jgi:membrane protease YdiL (CAAX protease family)
MVALASEATSSAAKRTKARANMALSLEQAPIGAPEYARPAMDASDLRTRLVRRFPAMEGALRGLDLRVTVIMTSAAGLLLLFRKFGGSDTFEQRLRPESLRAHHYLTVYGDYYWFLACFVLLGLVPLAFSLVPSLRPPSLGLRLGDARFGLKWTAILYGVMVPVIAAASLSPEFSRYYPLNSLLGNEAVAFFSGEVTPDAFLLTFIGYELLYGLYFLGWEFFFRGWLLFGLHDRLGFNSILAGNIPFVLMHLGKPLPEAFGSIFGGLALGLFALRTGSFWYCFLLHVLVAWTMDACALSARLWGH